MFSICLRHADHVRRYSVSTAQPSGWEMTLEHDRRLTRRLRFDDWHRVERAIAMLESEVSDLTARGWQIAAEDPARTS
jgi:hypothetical protein